MRMLLPKPLLEANCAGIRTAVGPGRFFTYTAPGQPHTILQRPACYTYTVNGVTFRGWVARLAAGAAVEDVSCADCTPPLAAPTP